MDAHFESVLNSSRSKPAFLQSDSFTGKRAGYVFKNGINGVGYYLDSPSVSVGTNNSTLSAADFVEPSSKRARLDVSASGPSSVSDESHSGAAGVGVDNSSADMDALLKQGESVETLDAAQLKHMVLVLDKKITSNQLMRSKYPSQPERFMASELDLHGCIEELYSVAAYPELYQAFVDHGGVKFILGMVAHENTDISLTSVGFLHELLDPDMILAPDNIIERDEPGDDNDEEEAGPDGRRVNIAMCVVDSFLEGQGLELLVQNLTRLDESSEEDAEGVHNTMAVLENLMEILPSRVATLVCEKTHILKFLILRLKSRTFDANKLYCSEVLSILLQTLDGGNQRRLCRLHGVDGMETLLQALHGARKLPALGQDEQECIQNTFLCLSSVLDVPGHQQQFLESQGLELLLRCMAERQYAAVGATKALKFALSAPDNCNHFIEINGLKFLFPLLMGHSIWKPGKGAAEGKTESGSAADKRNKKKAVEEKRACEESCVAVLAQLCLASAPSPAGDGGLGPAPGPAPGPAREDEAPQSAAAAAQQVCCARMLAKFTENGCEKTERCVELYGQYAARCEQTEKRLAQLRLQLLADEDEESLEELDDAEHYYLQRCSGGLTQLQELGFVLMWACYHSGGTGSREDSSSSACLMTVRTKLAADRLALGHVLTTVREAVAHINVDEVEAALAGDEDQENDGPFAEDVKADNITTKDLLLRKRTVLLSYCANFANLVNE
mgnify:FL=1